MTSAFPLFSSPNVPPPPVPAAGRSPKRAAAEARPIALIVDDEHLIADTIARILEMSGFEAVPTYSGLAALEQAAARCPDVLITDVVMPELNGIELAKQLLECCPSTKILLLSGQAATLGMITRARADGFNFELLAKPLHPDELLATLRRCGF
jgi:DNA-binding response OmpR family regulator